MAEQSLAVILITVALMLRRSGRYSGAAMLAPRRPLA
jgi:hypothetical protein